MKYLFFLLLFFTIETASAQTSNIQGNFSCSGQVTVTYDLNTPCPVDVTLYYSHNQCDWLIAQTVTGDLTAQVTGIGKTIVWDNYADNVRYGKFYFKVEAPQISPCEIFGGVMINGVCWATRNLDVGGVFVGTPQDLGALFQWGRKADGHERRTSPCWPISPACGTIIDGTVTSGMLDANGQVNCPAPPCGYFIRTDSDMLDWRTPQNNALWNSGTTASPQKTANDPCPEGWRVPTKDELSTLVQTAYVTKEWKNNGYLLTDIATNKELFLPAAGTRMYNSGSIFVVNTNGSYWSSTANPIQTVQGCLSFSNSTFSLLGGRRADGSSVRCVLE